MNDTGSIISGASKAGDIGGIIGKGGGVIGDSISKFTLYIVNMGVAEWVLLCVIFVGGFITWYLHKKHGLEFRLWPKKPKNTFN